MTVSRYLMNPLQIAESDNRMELLTPNFHPGRNAFPSFDWSRGSEIPRIVTTSWDDGNPHDLEIAELLRARGLPGTFYVPLRGLHGSAVLAGSDLRSLASQGFEIGGHGVTHAELPGCQPRALEREVSASKQRLEDTLGASVAMFAYPRGRHNRKVIEAVKQAGYLGARTTRMLASDFDFDPYRMPTSVQVYPHTRIAYLKNLLRNSYFGRAWTYLVHPTRTRDWAGLAKAIFDSILTKGGIWHLYGHSWEIHQHGLWDALSDVLSYVTRRSGVLYLSNCAILEFARKSPRAQREPSRARRMYEDSARS